MNNIAIIPARGGSKRILRKNIKDFLGKPIIAYSIEAAIESKLFDEVMVSTDDEEIAEVAMQYEAKVPFFRSKENSNDYATINDVLSEVLLKYKEIGKLYDYCCCILPTAPLIQSNRIEDAYNKLISNNFDSVTPITKFEYPIQRAFKTENGKLKWLYPEHAKTRSQDLEEAFHDAGQFYWKQTSLIINKKEFVKKGFIELKTIEVQDIDNESDWKMAEIKFLNK